MNPSDVASAAAKDKWITELKSRIIKTSAWAQDLTETRVDVNESADALEAQSTNDQLDQKKSLYECLFVGRNFGKDFLKHIKFIRCTFVRCSFDPRDIDALTIEGSYLINCVIADDFRKAEFKHCIVGNTRFRRAKDAIAVFEFCTTYSLRFETPPVTLNVTNSLLYNFNLAGPHDQQTNATLNLAGSLIVDSTLRNLKLTSESNLHVAANPHTKLTNIDLSDVEYFYEGDLAALSADRKSLPPKNIERPSSWAKFSLEDSEDDDIPF